MIECIKMLNIQKYYCTSIHERHLTFSDRQLKKNITVAMGIQESLLLAHFFFH